MDEEWGEGFFGAPFEALGNVNGAIYPHGAEELVKLVPGFLENGDILRQRAVRQNDHYTFLQLYPGSGPINMGLLLSNAMQDNKLKVISLYPVFEGLLNRLAVCNYKSWENGFEGMISADTGEIGCICYFDPFYYWDHWELRLGRNADFCLAALAFSLEIGRNEEIEVEHGPFYDLALEEFLRENPGKSAADMPTARLIMGSAQLLLPTRYTGEYHYRALVLDREEFRFLGDPVWRFHISFVIDEASQSPELWLYAAQHIIKGRIPKIGDYIEGFCWMSGYLPYTR